VAEDAAQKARALAATQPAARNWCHFGCGFACGAKRKE